MIARQVGEHGRMEVHAVNPRQRQAVRGNFHGEIAAAALLQLRRQPDHIQRFGSGVGRLANFVADAVLDGPDHCRKRAPPSAKPHPSR